MMYIKLDRNMNLKVTVNEPIYRGDHLSKKIIYLVPLTIGEIEMESSALYLSYIRADGTADIALLKRLDEKYKEAYFQYVLPVTTTLSRFPGEICTWLQIYSGPAHSPVIAKSGECMLNILSSTNMDDYISDRNLSLIYDMQRQMEEKVEKAEERIDETNRVMAEELSKKADNIIFNEEDSTIQLAATTVVVDEETGEESIEQIPIGDPIYVRSDHLSAAIVNAEIDEEGSLILTFADETTKDLGKVVGTDGKIYVPHVSERKILTFTLEDGPGENPEEISVDLNPSDEWGSIDESEIKTDYVWESL